jgi:hypothetical protein
VRVGQQEPVVGEHDGGAGATLHAAAAGALRVLERGHAGRELGGHGGDHARVGIEFG